jgi:hypothetical protein
VERIILSFCKCCGIGRRVPLTDHQVKIAISKQPWEHLLGHRRSPAPRDQRGIGTILPLVTALRTQPHYEKSNPPLAHSATNPETNLPPSLFTLHSMPKSICKITRTYHCIRSCGRWFPTKAGFEKHRARCHCVELGPFTTSYTQTIITAREKSAPRPKRTVSCPARGMMYYPSCVVYVVWLLVTWC